MKMELIIIFCMVLLSIPTTQAFLGLGSGSQLLLNEDVQSDSQTGLGTASIQSNKEWKVKYSTDTDFNVYITNEKDKTTEICLVVNDDSKCSGQLGDTKCPTKKLIYDDKNNCILDDKGKDCIELQKKKVELSDKKQIDSKKKKQEEDRYGYCAKLSETEMKNVGEYIKIGEQSTVLKYEEEQTIFYDYGLGNVSLGLINKDLPLSINNISISLNEDKLKFSGYDNLALNDTELYNYSYILNSTNPIRRFRNGIEIYEGNECEGYLCGEKHFIDFEDVCSREFNPTNISYIETLINSSIEGCNESFDINETIPNECFYNVTKSRIETTKANCQWNIQGNNLILDFISNRWIDPSAEWHNDSYNYRKAINISNTNVDSDLTNFPVLIKWSGDSDVNSNALSTGNDIRFTNSSGGELSYEREFFNGTSGIFWVKVPVVDSDVNSVIYMYYGNLTMSAGVDGEDASNVWDSGYLGVWHMNQSIAGYPTEDDLLDSTSNNIDGSGWGTTSKPVLQDAKTLKGQDFDGNDASNPDYIYWKDSDYSIFDTDLNNEMIFSMWFKLDSAAQDYDFLGGKIYSNGWDDGFGIYFTNDFSGNTINFYVTSWDVNYAMKSFAWNSDTSWHHVVGEYNATHVNIWLDGVAGTSDTYSSAILDNNGYFGLGGTVDQSNIRRYLPPVDLDEVRISNKARGGSWAKFEYYNINEADNELLFGSQETPEECINPTEDLSITEDTTFCSGTYYLNDSNNNGVISIDADNIILNCNGANIIGNFSDDSYGIYSNTQSNYVIKNCNLYNFERGLYLRYSTNADIFRNKIVNYTDRGINILGGDYNNISYNKIYNATTNIDTKAYYSTTTAEHNVLQHNLIKGGFLDGIYPYTTSINTTINNNTIITDVYDSRYGIYMWGDDSLITNNTYDGINSKTFERDIYIYLSDGNTLKNNTYSNDFRIYPLFIAQGCNHNIDEVNYTYEHDTTNVNIDSISREMIILCNASNSIVKDSYAKYGTFLHKSNNTILDNIQTLESSSNESRGIFIDFTHNTTIRNTNINNQYYGIFFYNGSNEYIEDSEFSDNARNLYWRYSEDLIINDTVLSGGTDFDIITDKGTIDLINVTDNNNYQWVYDDSTIISKYWYIDVQVYNSTTLLENAGVNITRDSNNLLSQLTNSNGRIVKNYFLDFNQTNTGKTLYSTYLINITHPLHYSNQTNFNLTTDNNIFWNVSLNEIIPIDTTPPTFTGTANYTLIYTIPWTANINATDETELSSFTINDSRFTINNSGYIYNNSGLGVNYYPLNITITDSSSNINWTIIYLNITKKTTELSFGITPSNNEDYGTETTATGSNCPTELDCNLYRNNVEKTNAETNTFGVGSYVYVYNTTSNQNYTADSETDTLTINQIAGTTSLTFNDTSPINYGSGLIPTCSVTTGETTASLIYNTSSLTSGNAYQFPAGNWLFNCSILESQNYTSNHSTSYFQINKISSNINLTIDDVIDGNKTIQQYEKIWINGSILNGDTTATLNLYLNGTLLHSNIGSVYNLTNYTAVGLHNITLIYPLTQNYSLSSKTYWLNVSETLIIDTTSPTFLQWNNQTITYKEHLEHNINATDETEFDSYSVNGTKFSIDSDGILKNNSLLSAGSYSVNVTINDTSNNINWTIIRVTVNKATGDVEFSPNPQSAITYGTSMTPTCLINSGETTAILSYNQSTLTSGSPYTFGAGNWLFNCSILETQNYTSDVDLSYYLVNKATTSLTVDTNPSGLANIEYGNSMWANGTNCPSQLTCNLFRDNGLIIEEISNPNTAILGVGTYIFTYNTTGNQNYTSDNENTLPFTVYEATPSITLTIDRNSDNKTIVNNTSIWLNGTKISGEGDIYLYKNGTLLNSGSTNVYNYSSFNGTGVYNISLIYQATQNYTELVVTYYVTVNTEPDTTPPTFLEWYNITTTYGIAISEDINATDETSFDSYAVNGSIFKIDSNGILENNSLLSASEYSVNITITDTAGNINWTIITITINKAQAQTSLSFNNTSPINYGSSLVTTCSNLVGEVLSNVVINNSAISSDTTYVFGAGSWLFNCSMAESQNYTANFTTSYFQINQATPSLSVSGTSPITYGTVGDVEGTNCPSQISCNLFRNNTAVSNPDTSTLGGGTYGYVYNTTGNKNYTSASDTFDMVVNKATTNLGLSITPSTSENEGTETTATGSNCPSQLTCNLFRDNVGVSNPDVDTLSTGSYVYVYNTTGNKNYTSDSETDTLTINAVVDNFPTFSNLRNFNHPANSSFSQSITASDDNGISKYSINNSVQFTINSGTGLITNITPLKSLVVYNINISVNDTSNQFTHGIFWINVTAQTTSKCNNTYTNLQIPTDNARRVYVRLCKIKDFKNIDTILLN